MQTHTFEEFKVEFWGQTHFELLGLGTKGLAQVAQVTYLVVASVVPT